MRILVVEDETKVANALREGLESENYEVAVASTGEEGFFLVSEQPFDLVVLDLMLPGRNGLEVLATVRRQGLTTPVLVLTARDTVGDRVQGLDTGADDYLVKPFAFPELLARIRALLRRGRMEPAARLSCADLALQPANREATRADIPLDLTAKEFELLHYLVRHQGNIVSRETLAREIWKETARATPLDNVIDVTMARLRRKVDDGFEQKLLHTVRGVGFTLREESK